MTAPADLPIEFADRAVYLPAAATLVLADCHLGKGRASNVDAPLGDGTDIQDRLEGLLERWGPDTVVVAGDLVDSFQWIPQAVERLLTTLREAVADAGASFVVTPGNHDTSLATVFDGELLPAYRLADGETVVCHGHDAPSLTAERYVIGHDHPALSVEGRKLPCYLYGPDLYEGSDVLVLPPFTKLARGTTVNDRRARDFQSPMVTAVDPLHPAIRDRERDETLWFPPLGECRSLL